MEPEPGTPGFRSRGRPCRTPGSLARHRTDRLDRVLTHRVWGTLVFLLLMFVMFQAIFTGAKPLMNLVVMAKDGLGGWIDAALPAGPFKSLVLEGALEGVGGILVFIPQILILFAFIAVLEDCGYMARAAFLMDKLMSRCGLSGKSFIPMLSSIAFAGHHGGAVTAIAGDRLATIRPADELLGPAAALPPDHRAFASSLAGRHGWPPDDVRDVPDWADRRPLVALP